MNIFTLTLLVSLSYVDLILVQENSDLYKTFPLRVPPLWRTVSFFRSTGWTQCAITCSITADCVCVFYNSTSLECLHLKPQEQCSSGMVLPDTVNTMRRGKGIVLKLDVFRSSGGMGAQFYNPWMDDSYSSSCGPEVYDMNNKINYTFKHPILANWGSINKREVHLTLWKNGSEVVRLVFDGRNSTKTNWFSLSRLSESSYEDLINSTTASISLEGFQGRRRFYILLKHQGCGGDYGWTCFSERDFNCAWENHPPYPAFIYSTSNRVTQWNSFTDLGLADDLLISMVIEI